MSRKVSYRIRNWSEYNKSLVNRGSITFWFSDDYVQHWMNDERDQRRGRPKIYSDTAIECMLIIRCVFHLPLRALQGFVCSLMEVSDLPLPCPNYTTVCRRAKSLQIRLPKSIKAGENIHVLVDSSGFKIFGEGEWKTRKYGYSKRRTWRKLHVAVCARTQCAVGAVLTTNNVGDSEVFGELIDGIEEPIETMTGDGAYDTIDCYDTAECYGAKPIFPPRRGAKRRTNDESSLIPRNQAIGRITELGGDDEARKKWKQESCYHRRSLAETYFFRYKTIFGANLKSRSFINQAKESFARCAAMNKMTSLGMPESYRVE